MAYPLESKHPPAALSPAEEIRDENDNAEPELSIYQPPEPPSIEEVEEALKASEQREASFAGPHESPVLPAVAGPLPPADRTAAAPVQAPPVRPPQSSGLEIIPPTSGPVHQSAGPDSGIVVYPPQSPPSMEEIRETLGPHEKKGGNRAGNVVKWFLTDPKKEAARAKAGETKLPREKAPVADAAIQAGVQKPITDAAPEKRSRTGSKIDALLEDFGNSIVEQEKKDEEKAALRSSKQKEMIDWFMGRKPEKQNKQAGATGESMKPMAKPMVRASILSRIGGSPGKKNGSDDLPEFAVGELSRPGLDGPVTGVNVTYAVSPPFQYINILFDGEELVYNIKEPPLGEGQKKRLAIIERSLEKLISSKIVAIKAEEREQFLRDKFEDIIRMYNWTLTEEYKDRMFFYLRKKYLGYDRIEILMKDHYIEDISCNGPNAYVYIYHRIYGSIRTNVSFDDITLNKFVMRMAQISGRHISILQPIKDISLPDGSRANLTLGTEVTKKGATFTIRKFKERPISPIELMEYNSIDSRALAFLWTLLDYKRSILVSGGTASGKTTLMNVLCSFIKPELKIVSLEDTPELNLAHPNWIQSVTRSGFGAEAGASSASTVSGISAPGKSPGDIGLYDLLVAALRQRPEYILVGEVRGAEAFTLFQAIAVGHAAMGTIHAGTMRELLSRVESNPMNVPRTLFASMDAVCFSALVRRGDRNVRRVLQIVEVLELDTDGNLVTNPVFRWDAFTDKFVFSGKSHIFEKIEGQLGITQEAILKEMDNRSRFLQDLCSLGIKDYYEVVERIREYELNKLTGSKQN